MTIFDLLKITVFSVFGISGLIYAAYQYRASNLPLLGKARIRTALINGLMTVGLTTSMLGIASIIDGEFIWDITAIFVNLFCVLIPTFMCVLVFSFIGIGSVNRLSRAAEKYKK